MYDFDEDDRTMVEHDAENHGLELGRETAIYDLQTGRIREMNWDSVILELMHLPRKIALADIWPYKFTFFHAFKEEYTEVMQVHHVYHKVLVELEQRQALVYCAHQMAKRGPHLFDPALIGLIGSYVFASAWPQLKKQGACTQQKTEEKAE